MVQSSVANFATTSETVSPLHILMQEISGPCHTTQLDDMGLQPDVKVFEETGIIRLMLYYQLQYLAYNKIYKILCTIQNKNA
jgi:hypothetical protein